MPPSPSTVLFLDEEVAANEEGIDDDADAAAADDDTDTHGSVPSPLSRRRHGETPGSGCPGPMPQSQAWACGPGHIGCSRRCRTPRWRTRTLFRAAAVGGGRELCDVALSRSSCWVSTSTHLEIPATSAEISLVDIYVTNNGAKKSTQSQWTKKSIAILKSIAICPV